MLKLLNRVRMHNWCLLPGLLLTATCAHQLLFAQSDLSASDQTASLTYHSAGSEVRLVFFATDEHHHSVTDLQKDDFAVVDDDMVIRNFRSFAPSTPLKLDIIVLLDASESVLPHFQSEVADVLQLLSQWPSARGDNVSLLSFSGNEVHPICALACPASLADRIASLPQGGATPLFDAIDTASTLIMQRRQPGTWPVIILFSDGQDTISRSSFRDASEKILASEAHVYAIDIGNGTADNGTATLQRLADDSGGRYVRIREGWQAALNNVLNSIVDDLHAAWVVTYPLPDSPGSDFHPVRILPTRNLAWQFHCRRGYFNHLSSAN